MRATAFMVMLWLALLSTAVMAEVPALISYQGTLTDAGGAALDTTVSMTFTIYDDSTGGSTKWTETQSAVEVSAGIFNVLLGRVNSISDTVFKDPERWLGVQVGGDPELTPRQRIVTVAHAFHAAVAETADYALSAPAVSDGDWTISGSDMYSAVPGGVGIGTASPLCKLDVSGSNQRIRVGNWMAPNSAGAIISDGDTSGAVFSNNAYHTGISWANQNTGKVGALMQISDDDIFMGRSGSGAAPSVATNMMIEGATGYVGIGTAAPSAPLHIDSQGNTELRIEHDDVENMISFYANTNRTGYISKNDDSEFMRFSADGNTAHLVIQESNGYVGIGTVTPNYPLHVVNHSGDNFSAAIRAASVSTGTGQQIWGVYGEVRTSTIGNAGAGIFGSAINATGAASGVRGDAAGEVGRGVRAWATHTTGVNYGIYAETSSPNGYAGYFRGGMNYFDGDVGIGTTTPSYPLDVVGDINANTLYRIGGFTVLRRTFTNNLMVGVGAGENNTGDRNTFVGDSTGVVNQGDYNTCLGIWAGRRNTTGDHNTFVGPIAGWANTTGGYNTFVGSAAGHYNTTAYGNTFLGAHAGEHTTTGNGNTCVGEVAGYNNIGGIYNTYLGMYAGYNNAEGDSNLFIGYKAGYNEQGSGLLYIANGSDDSDVLIYGNFNSDRVGINTTSPAEELEVVGEVQVSSAYNGRALDVYSTVYTTGQLVNIQTAADITSANDALQILVGAASSDECQFIECERGSDFKFRVYGDGDVTADGTFSPGGADVAEMIAVSAGAATVEPGDVMVIDPEGLRAAVKSSQPRSTLVAGIYSTKPGFLGSERDWDKPTKGDDEERGTYTMAEMAAQFNEVPLAVVGIVPCKVSAENGAINPGDLLVTSATPGHAMRDEDPRTGTVLGKALESLSSGTGTIRVLVTLQ